MRTTLLTKQSGEKSATSDGSSAWSSLWIDFKVQLHLRPWSTTSSVRASSQQHASCKSSPSRAQLLLLNRNLQPYASSKSNFSSRMVTKTPVQGFVCRRNKAHHEANSSNTKINQTQRSQQTRSSSSKQNEFCRHCAIYRFVCWMYCGGSFWGWGFAGCSSQWRKANEISVLHDANKQLYISAFFKLQWYQFFTVHISSPLQKTSKPYGASDGIALDATIRGHPFKIVE